MKDTFEFTLNNPLTEEQWDMITDVDFDRTDRITFHTKHGKEIEFAKVIRCKECKYYPQNSRRWNDPDLIQTYIHCKFMDKNDFCSKALPIVNPKMVTALKKRIEEHFSQIEAEPKEADE